MKKIKYTNEEGMTLVEVLAAVVILMIILTTIVYFFPQMSISNQKNIEKNRAINLAKGELIYWQKKLELDTFKDKATKKSCFIEEQLTTCYEFQTKISNVEYEKNFYVSIKLWEQSELEEDLKKEYLEEDLKNIKEVYRVHIEIKNKEHDTKISEIFGYLYL